MLLEATCRWARTMPSWAAASSWIDAAVGYWNIWLIAAGHTPASADRWAAKIPARHTAPGEGITAFATANNNVWAEISTPNPDLWTLRLAAAATTWREYRRAP
ncbi:hypothetical protein ABZZ04_01405 [Streptomyces sp. NPDC006435]|uniref:hypothetical protein n=1 Tax=Streptomyces sp. NPDC006435 TaxID=3154300 RepID=UPI0033B1649A